MSQAAPPVSVLLPARNAAETLPAALESIARQTDPDFELIVVEDRSEDATLDVLRAAAAEDPRVRVLRAPAAGRGGDLVGALEQARRAARGRFLLRMDADDLAHPERLARCRALLEADPRVAAAGCLVRSFPEAQLRPGRLRYDAWLNGLRRHEDMARERFVESPLAHPSVLLRADAVAQVGGYRRFQGPEDYDLWLRLLAAGWRLAKADRVLHFWREAPGRLSRLDPRYGPAGMARARADALAALARRERRALALVGAGTAGRRLARLLLERGVPVPYFLDTDPKKVGRAPHGVPVLEHHTGMRARRGELLVTCLNAWGARARARSWLTEAGLVEGVDFFLGG